MIISGSEKPKTIEMHYRAPGQVGLVKISVTYDGPKGFTLDVDTVKSKPGQAHAEGRWTLQVIVP